MTGRGAASGAQGGYQRYYRAFRGSPSRGRGLSGPCTAGGAFTGAFGSTSRLEQTFTAQYKGH